MSEALYDRIVATVEAGDHADGTSLWDYYEVLNIASDASPQDVKRAYRRLALRFHPDKALPGQRNRAEILFRVIAAA